MKRVGSSGRKVVVDLYGSEKDSIKKIVNATRTIEVLKKEIDEEMSKLIDEFEALHDEIGWAYVATIDIDNFTVDIAVKDQFKVDKKAYVSLPDDVRNKFFTEDNTYVLSDEDKFIMYLRDALHLSDDQIDEIMKNFFKKKTTIKYNLGKVDDAVKGVVERYRPAVKINEKV
jgi:hypothetical protein